MKSKQLSIRDMTPKKDTIVKLRINTKLKERFSEYAKQNNTTMSQLLSNAIDDYLKGSDSE
jgi:antitoxin component of RelBE/YafQ-DinJ toxin-antitoxin module